MGKDQFSTLIAFLRRMPAIEKTMSYEANEGKWWVKIQIQIHHPLAWHVVQEFGYVLNYLSLDERLGTTFYPVSPPPYLNGGPSDYLSWIIENTQDGFTADLTKSWLESRVAKSG
jgi:hypothetical protein